MAYLLVVFASLLEDSLVRKCDGNFIGQNFQASEV